MESDIFYKIGGMGSNFDKPARLTIVPDCQIRYWNTNSERVTLSGMGS